jgi:protein-disulfide isomerase
MTHHRSRSWTRPATIPIALAALLFGTPAAAGEPSGRADAEAAEETALLRAIASRARSPSKTEDFVVELGQHPGLGEPSAMLTLIEFSDLQCGFCRRHLNSILPVLLERYVSTGRMRYVFFDFPVEQRHPEAYGAAVGARCAADQGAVQPMRERLYRNPELLQQEHMPDHAAALGLDGASFASCLQDPAKAEAIQRDLELGQRLMVRGTPTFLVGYTQGEGARVRVLRRIVGAQPLDVFETAIDGVIAEAQGSMAAMR